MPAVFQQKFIEVSKVFHVLMFESQESPEVRRSKIQRCVGVRKAARLKYDL